MERKVIFGVVLSLALMALARSALFAASLSQTEDASTGGLSGPFAVGESPSITSFQLPQLPGWPNTMGVHPNYAPSGCALADIDQDGYLDIIAGSTDGSFHVWDYQGNELPGWPKTGLGAIQTEAAVGDIDGDGDLEIAVPNREGNLYIWNHDGTNLTGWPQSVDETGGFKAAILFDLDEDGDLEVILGQRLYPRGRVQVFRADGTLFPGWPQYLDYMCVATPSVADVDGDGLYEICAVSYYSIYLWDQNGDFEPGWPILNYYGGASYAQPTLCDLDGDQDLEVLVMYYTGSQDYVSVFHHNGTAFAGWPQPYPGPQGYICPVMGDIDGDSDFEIFGGGHVFGGPDLSSRHHNGIQVPGWPVIVGLVECSPVIFDLDGDGDREVVVGSNHSAPGYLYAFHGDGSSVAGWPFTMSAAAMVNSPAVEDVDLDGDLEIALVNRDGTVNLWTSDGVPYRGYYTEWGSYFHDLWNTGWFHPLAPQGLAASLAPSGVRLTWNGNLEPDVAGYNLYRSETSGGPYNRVNSALIPDTSYADTTVSPHTTYFYVATCFIRARAESRLSDEVSITTGVEETGEARTKMQETALLRIQPNPFSHTTMMKLKVKNEKSKVSLKVYDLSGRLIKTLVHGGQSVTNYESPVAIRWDGRDGEGRELPPGLYFLKLTSSDFERTGKIVLLR